MCEREALELVGVLEELDRNGGDAARPLWNEAIERVERGEIGAIVVWNPTGSAGVVTGCFDGSVRGGS